jgi:hypothetical protein
VTEGWWDILQEAWSAKGKYHGSCVCGCGCFFWRNISWIVLDVHFGLMQSPAKAWPNSSTRATRSFLPGPNPAGRPQTVFLSGGYCDAIERAAARGKNTDLAAVLTTLTLPIAMLQYSDADGPAISLHCNLCMHLSSFQSQSRDKWRFT